MISKEFGSLYGKLNLYMSSIEIEDIHCALGFNIIN